MTAYVDYTYYTGTYLGSKIAEADFPQAALRASAEIDALTFERAAGVVTAGTDLTTIDKIKMATCAVADAQFDIEQAPNQGAIQSERVGSHSVTYVAGGSGPTDEQIVSSAASLYLASTGLMFGGFYANERGYDSI